MSTAAEPAQRVDGPQMPSPASPAVAWTTPMGAELDALSSPAISVRVAALGGVVGPALFIAAWAIGSTTARGYSASETAISELAAIGADTRALMTAGFIAFALGVFPYAAALRRVLGGPAWIGAAGTGIATLLVAAIPLGRSTSSDHWHGIIAVVGYTTLALTPLLAIRPFLNQRCRGVVILCVVTAAASGTALLLSDTGLPTGLFQRIGLTTGQIWIAGSALAIILGRLPERRTSERPTGAPGAEGAAATR